MFHSGGRRNESTMSGTGLLPRAMEIDFLERAYMMDIKVGQQKKDGAARVMQTGLDAMIKSKSDIVMASHNNLQSTFANILLTGMLAEEHRGVAQPKQ